MELVFVHVSALMCCICLHLLVQTLYVLQNVSDKDELQTPCAVTGRDNVYPA